MNKRLCIQVEGGIVEGIFIDGDLPDDIDVYVTTDDEDSEPRVDVRQPIVHKICPEDMDAITRYHGISAQYASDELRQLPRASEVVVAVEMWCDPFNDNDMLPSPRTFYFPVIGIDGGPVHPFGIVNIDQEAPIDIRTEDLI